MARVHEAIAKAYKTMLVDSSSSMDRYNLSTFIYQGHEKCKKLLASGQTGARACLCDSLSSVMITLGPVVEFL